MKNQIHEEPRIVASAERRMQGWIRREETESRGVGSAALRRSKVAIGPYITLLRGAGAGGSESPCWWDNSLDGKCSTRTSWTTWPIAFTCPRNTLALQSTKCRKLGLPRSGTGWDRVIPHEKM